MAIACKATHVEHVPMILLIWESMLSKQLRKSAEVVLRAEPLRVPQPPTLLTQGEGKAPPYYTRGVIETCYPYTHLISC